MRNSSLLLRVLLSLLFLFMVCLPVQAAYYEGDDLGYLDYVTVNEQEFENFDRYQLVFYPEDLVNGRVIIKGLLEQEQDDLPVDDLMVQITLDGGETWREAKGTSRWMFQFTPEVARSYDFSIRVVRRTAELPVEVPHPEDLLYAFGNFAINLATDQVDANGLVSDVSTEISGLPGQLHELLPSLVSAEGTLPVSLSGFQVDVVNRSVTAGSVSIEPPGPLEFQLGPVDLKLSAIHFSTSGASIDGEIDLAPLNLPIDPLSFDGLNLSRFGIQGEIDLVEASGIRNINIISGAFGFGLSLDQLKVEIDPAREPAKMVSLSAFSGSLKFGPGFGSLEIPDLTLLADGAISWGKNLAAGVADSDRSLSLPGGLFRLGDLGGGINLADKSLTISGTLILPPELGSASVAIPADQPLTLSANRGLSTSGPLVFDAGGLPDIALHGIATKLRQLQIDLSNNQLSGMLKGGLSFPQFNDLQIAVKASIGDGRLGDVEIDTAGLQESFDLAGFASLSLSNVTAGIANDNFYVQFDGDLTPTHDLFAEYRKKVEFEGLRLYHNSMEFIGEQAGWHQMPDGTSIGINSASVALQEYGLGVENGLLWFGLKGAASILDNKTTLSAKVYQNGTYAVGDLNFDGLKLALGQFFLRTSAQLRDGVLSGAGSINVGFLADYLPAAIKDPLTGELNVRFENLNVDLDRRKVLGGTVSLPFPEAVEVDLGLLTATLNAVSFGTDGASVDGDITLKQLAGVALTRPLEGLEVGDIDLSPTGFQGVLSWTSPGEPVSLPVISGEYGLTLLLSRLALKVDTGAADPLQRLKLDDLDGSIRLGSGYAMREPVQNLQMLADGAIAWGVAAAGELQDQYDQLQNDLAGMSFTIPGTRILARNLDGRLYLNDRALELWGQLQLPSAIGGGSIGLQQQNALRLSASGISTNGPVDIDPGTLSEFKLVGFPSSVHNFSIGISNNSVSGAIGADLTLSRFDNIPIAVSAAFNGTEISALEIASDRLERHFTIGDFAVVNLSSVEAGYRDAALFIDLDGSLTLNNSAIGNLQRSFDFSGLQIYKDTIAMASADLGGMRDIADATFNVNESLQMVLRQYGFGVSDNRFWVALSGGVNFEGQEMSATARVYHDGQFEMTDLGADNLTIAIGDFALRTSFDYSGGVIEQATGSLNLGSLMASIPDRFKNPLGELPVDLSNLEIDLDDLTSPKLKSGVITFRPQGGLELVTDFFSASIDGFEVGAQSSEPYGKILGGSIAFNAVGSLPGLSGVSLTDVAFNGGGINGDLNWQGEQSLNVFEDDQYGISAELSAVTIAFDSSKTTIREIASVKDLQGDLHFGPGYGDSISSALAFAEGAYSFALETAANAGASARAITLPGTAIKLRGASGAIDFEAGSVTVGGLIAVPYEGAEIAFETNGLTFSATGIGGRVALSNPVAIEGLGFPTQLTAAAIGFSGFGLSSGNLGLDLTLEQFFDLQVAAAITLDKDGVSDWSVGGETDQTFTADAGFANLTVSDLGSGYDSTDGLYFSLNTKVDMNPEALLSALPNDIDLSGLQVFATSLVVEGAQMANSFNGATASLAGLDLTLSKLGLGYGNEKFYLLAKGNLNIAELCEAGAEVKLYQDLSYDLNEIEVAFNKPAAAFEGSLSIYSDDPTFGTGFGASLDVLIAETIGASGALQVGSKTLKEGASFAYWRVAVKTSATIPMSPLPLNVYGIGGGLAYHMTITNSADGPAFVPSASSPFALTAKLDLGTTDNGTSYFGKFALNYASGKVQLSGDSWFLEGRSASGDPHLRANITIGTSPSMLQISATSKLSKELSGMTLIGVNGQVDLLFAENDWHIHFGSASQKLTVTALEFLKGQGYVQLDSDGLAFGVSYSFDLTGNAWIFYGSVYGGAQLDLQARVQPFYINARGELWLGLKAGVKVAGKKYSIFSASANLAAQIKAPPVYIGLSGKVKYSLLFGTISGTWSMTFTMPDDPPPGAGDESIEAIPLFAFSTPSDAATDVTRLPVIELNTTLPLMDPFQYDDGNWYILCVKDLTAPNDVVDVITAGDGRKAVRLLQTGSPGSKELTGGRSEPTTLSYTPLMQLSSGKSYSYESILQLRTYNKATETIGPVVKEETAAGSFTTTTEPLSIAERIYDVYPDRATSPVYPQTPIYLVTKALWDGVAWNWFLQTDNMSIKLYNAAGEEVPVSIEGAPMQTDNQAGTSRFMIRLVPEQPLKPVRMVENSAGERRPMVENADGSFSNPFVTVASTEATASQGATRTSDRQSSTRATLADRTLNTNTTVTPDASSASGILGGTTSYPGNVVTYREFWDGEYSVRLFNNAEKKYSWKFNLTVPEETTRSSELYADSSAVINSGGIENLRFEVKANVDQDDYNEDVSAWYAERFDAVLDELWPAFENSNYGADSPLCQYRSPQEVAWSGEPFGMMAGSNLSWAQVEQTLHPSIRRELKRFVLEQCAPLAAAVEGFDREYQAYQEEAFDNHPNAEFRTLLVHFSSVAPINWQEIELQIYERATGSTFSAGDYVIRSQPGSADHTLELKVTSEQREKWRQLLPVWANTFGSTSHAQEGSWQLSVSGNNFRSGGNVSFFSRKLMASDDLFNDAMDGYSLQRDQRLIMVETDRTYLPEGLFQ